MGCWVSIQNITTRVSIDTVKLEKIFKTAEVEFLALEEVSLHEVNYERYLGGVMEYVLICHGIIKVEF